jgi:flagellar biosynthetic protein FliQ
MTTDGAIDLLRNAMLIAGQVAGPVLLAALFVGLLVGVFQTATQVNEASVSYLAKLIAVAIALIVVGPLMLTQLVDYTRTSIKNIAGVVR